MTTRTSERIVRLKRRFDETGLFIDHAYLAYMAVVFEGAARMMKAVAHHSHSEAKLAAPYSIKFLCRKTPDVSEVFFIESLGEIFGIDLMEKAHIQRSPKPSKGRFLRGQRWQLVIDIDDFLALLEKAE